MRDKIEIKNLSKKYQIHPKGRTYKIIQEDLPNKLTNLYNQFFNKTIQPEFWALKEVTFSVRKGEVLGIIGRNGSGKSTLLKILGQITYPTTGSVVVRGRVSSLLEAGPGFHSELSGKENIYLNGIILGIKRSEIDKYYQTIVEFSGVEQFIDIPVKFYSSGMYVRLAFSISIHLNPEILLLDEILSVGDIDFQKRSMEKIEAIVKNKKVTVVIVSHTMDVVKKYCNRVILFENGKIKKIGFPDEIISYYLQNSEVII